MGKVPLARTVSLPATRTEVARLLSAILVSRLVINTAFRMPYAFMPQFSRGLGVDLQTMSALIGVRSGVGFLSPLFGPLSDRIGRRQVMLGGLALLVATAAIAFLFSSPAPFAAGFIGLGLAKVIFEPSAAAYLADRIPYERRGLVMGISELGWASGALIGVPLAGIAIAAWGWQSPYALVAVGSLIALGWTWFALPKTHAGGSPAQNRGMTSGAGALLTAKVSLAGIARHRSAVLMLLVTCLLLVALEMFVVSYAAWFEQAFGLGVLALGAITATFAAADVCGEVLTMWGVDRFGKKPALFAGVTLTALFYFVMPLLGTSLAVAIAALFLFYVCFEFTIVSVFPLVSELAPEARATMISLVLLSESAGRVAGAPAGAWLFGGYGFGAIGVAAGLITAVAAVVLWRGVREGQTFEFEAQDSDRQQHETAL